MNGEIYHVHEQGNTKNYCTIVSSLHIYVLIQWSSNKNSTGLFVGTWQDHPKFFMKSKMSKNSQDVPSSTGSFSSSHKQTMTSLRKEKGERQIKNLKKERATVIKAVWYRHRIRQVDQWSRMNSQEIDPLLYRKYTTGLALQSLGKERTT